MANPEPRGFLKPKHPKVVVPEQPADPYADLYGYVTPPETTGFRGFVDQLKYINRTIPGAFMQLGAGLMGGDAEGGIRVPVRNCSKRRAISANWACWRGGTI